MPGLHPRLSLQNKLDLLFPSREKTPVRSRDDEINCTASFRPRAVRETKPVQNWCCHEPHTEAESASSRL